MNASVPYAPYAPFATAAALDLMTPTIQARVDKGAALTGSMFSSPIEGSSLKGLPVSGVSLPRSIVKGSRGASAGLGRRGGAGGAASRGNSRGSCSWSGAFSPIC